MSKTKTKKLERDISYVFVVCIYLYHDLQYANMAAAN